MKENAVHKKLLELSGAGSVDCGDFKSSLPDELRAGSKCAEDAFRSNGPFFIEYEMPGLTVGVAGNAQGKFYSVQSGRDGAGLTSGECPAALRVASSGRVTCYAPATSPTGPGMKSGSNPHGPVEAMPAEHS